MVEQIKKNAFFNKVSTEYNLIYPLPPISTCPPFQKLAVPPPIHVLEIDREMI